MMKLSSFLIPCALLGVLAACHRAPTAEELGQRRLKQARHALAEGRTDNASAQIDSLRHLEAEALNAREEGILLLDSIDLYDARHKSAPDSALRVEFYTKKLEHDRGQFRRH